jgi:hypothetical protein
MDGWQPPELADAFWGGGLRVVMALKALLCSGDDASPHHWSVLRAIHTLNSCKHYICLLGGLSTIHSTHLRRAQGLMLGTRGAFPLVAAMVGYGCVGQCWPLEADVRSTYCRNSRNCLQKFFYSYVDPIYSWHLTRQLKKEDLGNVNRLVFWKHKNTKTYLSRQQTPEKYWTPSTGTKCKNIVLHIPFAPR